MRLSETWGEAQGSGRHAGGPRVPAVLFRMNWERQLRPWPVAVRAEDALWAPRR